MNLRKLLHLLVAVSIVFLWSCSSNHEHHDHEGHDHEHEEHDHDHEGHDHEHEGEEDADDEHMPHEEDVKFSPERAKTIGLTTEIATPGEFSDVIKTSGRVITAGGAVQVISAPTSGIIRFNVSTLAISSAVSSGQALFTISSKGMESSDGQAALKAAVESARTVYNRVKSQYDKQLATLDELHEAEAALKAAQAALDGYANKAANGTLSITSPISGHIASLDVKPGEFVAAGQQLATVVTQQRLKVQASLTEKYFGRAESVTGANIIVPADPDRIIKLSNYNGKVVGRGQSSDAGHSMPLYLEFDNPGNMVEGGFVEVYLLSSPRANVITVPKSALVEEQGIFYVFVKEGEKQYHKTAVKKGSTDGSRVEIKEGLKGGEEVVTVGAQELKLASNAGSVPGHTHNH